MALLATTACAAPNPTAPAPRPPNTTGDPSRTYALDQVYVLEVAGVPPDDTTLSVALGVHRVIVLRHGPPDNLTFAEVTLPAAAADSAPAARDSVRLQISPRPGVYGIDLESTAPVAGASVTFKYPVHFSAPVEATKQFGSDAAFEAVLAVGQLVPGGIRFLVSSRPASDNLRAALPGPGSYVVGAPVGAPPGAQRGAAR